MMLATIGDEDILSSADYVFEPKLDGHRALCTKKGGKLIVTSRNGRDITADFPEFDFLKDIRARDCVLDGEIIIYDDEGNPSFALMQQRRSHGCKALYCVFDILQKNGKDLRSRPLLERKKVLESTVHESAHLRTIGFTADGKKLWQRIVERDLEGVIAKRRDSRYVEGRSLDWVKVKRLNTVDAVIVGYTAERRAISSLALGIYDDDTLTYIGKVGTGFNDKTITAIHRLLQETAKSTVDVPRDVIRVKPIQVCEVKYLAVTQDKKLRAPVFLRIRTDKNPDECTVSQLTTLQAYKDKRDFSKTAEPTAVVGKSAGHLYVIQKHNARRLHFDFRLEHNGVLKSWAVPKGLSDNPSDKRLAVMVEDHPLEYATFSGTIPAGQYGAGTVEVWDTGRYVNITVKNGVLMPLDAAITKGHFIIYIKGKKLSGTYGFTRIKDNNWIAVKKREEEPFPESVTIDGHKISFTNLEKTLDKDIRKGHLVNYYRAVAPLMLKHVKDRPLSMMRFPDGVEGKRFFQKNTPDYFPPWVLIKDVRGVRYPIITNEAGIVYLANQVAEPHVMPSRYKRPTRPDKIIFDLDPDKVDLKALKTAAKTLGGLLRQIGLTPYIMTTGGKGYHVTAPIKPELDNKGVRDFALKIASVLVNDRPEMLTTELRKDKRKGRIFIDVNRISPGQTAIAPYGVRAKSGLTVACPFEWDELPNMGPTTVTILNPPKQDAWKDFDKKAVSLKSVMKRLRA